MDYYFLFVWGCVEPELVGPFATIEDRNSEAKKYREEHGNQNDFFTLEVTKGCQIDVGGFVGDLFDE